MKLEAKVAAVTGAGSGMGKAIALAYAYEGAKVVVADLNLDAAQSAAQEIAAAGGSAIATQTDVRDQVQAQAMIDATVEQFGGLDIFVNNAGVDRIIPFLETTNEDVTGAAIFLASSDSDYMTQQSLNVDGGDWPG